MLPYLSEKCMLTRIMPLTLGNFQSSTARLQRFRTTATYGSVSVWITPSGSFLLLVVVVVVAKVKETDKSEACKSDSFEPTHLNAQSHKQEWCLLLYVRTYMCTTSYKGHERVLVIVASDEVTKRA